MLTAASLCSTDALALIRFAFALSSPAFALSSASVALSSSATDAIDFSVSAFLRANVFSARTSSASQVRIAAVRTSTFARFTWSCATALLYVAS